MTTRRREGPGACPVKSAATLPVQEVSVPPTCPFPHPQLKMIGRSALTDRNCSESAQPGLRLLLCPLHSPRVSSLSGAGSPLLTVLKTQDDVPQVETSLLLGEGLVTGHFHDRPMGRAGRRDVSPESGLVKADVRWRGNRDWAVQTPQDLLGALYARTGP